MIYRKRGVVVRWENGTRIRVTESGVAIEKGERFECHPEPGEAPALEAHDLPRIQLPNAERLIVIHGIAEHEYGENRWREETKRLHVSITHDKERALIDQADFDLTHIDRVAAALQRTQRERDAPKRIRFAKNVTAALVPFLNGIQTAGGKDGYGNDLVDGGEGWYRPSYRVRPVKTKMNVRLEHEVSDIDYELPEAIALLRPADGLVVRVLIEERQRVYPAVVRVTKIRAVATERTFYPYGAGSFGAEMMF